MSWSFYITASFLMIYPASGTTKMCSEYLLSGFSGVPDEAFTASSSFSGQDDFSPDNARLYYERHNSQSASGWCSDTIDTNTYIQVELETEATVDSVSLQGRGDYGQWVTEFYLKYSTDSVTWKTVLASDNNPKLFTGNTDTNTVVRSDVSPPITAKYFRINARSWVSRPCLRFDLGGCKHLPEVGSTKQSRYTLASIPAISNLGQLINLQPSGTSLQHCGVACHRENGCMSFTFDRVTQICLGYPSIKKISYSREEMPYYYNTVYDRSQGYKHAESGDFSYKVIEMRQNKTNASDWCVSQGSRLTKVSKLDRQTTLQTAIQQNNLLKQDFRFYVSGQYTTQWQHSDGDVIDSSLWSPLNPDPVQGHCVMLTQTGLSSVDCSTMLFLICEI